MKTKKAVLLVEDSQDDVLLVQFAWEKTGASAPLNVVRDGAEALRYLFGEGSYADRRRNPLPSLVLLDLKMPYVQGLEVLKQIRRHPDLRKLIVVILSSSASDLDVEKAYELGANSFLVKPSSNEEREELMSRVQRYWLESNMPAPSLHGSRDPLWRDSAEQKAVQGP
jgi:CheY-like chemotaxis protein